MLSRRRWVRSNQGLNLKFIVRPTFIILWTQEAKEVERYMLDSRSGFWVLWYNYNYKYLRFVNQAGITDFNHGEENLFSFPLAGSIRRIWQDLGSTPEDIMVFCVEYVNSCNEKDTEMAFYGWSEYEVATDENCL